MSSFYQEFSPKELVVVRGEDLRPGQVVSVDDVGAIVVQLFSSPGQVVSVERKDLLRGTLRRDRLRIIQLQSLRKHRGLRVACIALESRLPGEDLVLSVAAFVVGPGGLEFPHQFSGYARQVITEYYWYDKGAQPRPFHGPAGHVDPQDGLDEQLRPWSPEGAAAEEATEADARPRIDCGAAVVGPGQVAFVGGCGSHPNAAYGASGFGFFRSAVLYDSLFDQWRGLPPMRCRRHGAAAAAVGRLLFVLGGQYVDADVPCPLAPGTIATAVVAGVPVVVRSRQLAVEDFCEVRLQPNLCARMNGFQDASFCLLHWFPLRPIFVCPCTFSAPYTPRTTGHLYID